MNKIAIMLLAHISYDYTYNFCKQFEGDDRFQIYIHIDTKSNMGQGDFDLLQEFFPNIKSIIKKHDCGYYNISLIDAEFDLLKEAYNDENIYYILCSESDYLIYDLDYVYNYLTNSTYNYIFHFPNFSQYTDIQLSKQYCYLGHQWFVFNKELVYELIYNFNKTYYNELQKLHTEKRSKLALDELYFQNLLLVHYADKFNLINSNSLHWVVWSNYKRNGHSPITLMRYDMYKYIKGGICNNLFIRKIDYTCNECIELVNNLKQYIKDNNITIQI